MERKNIKEETKSNMKENENEKTQPEEKTMETHGYLVKKLMFLCYSSDEIKEEKRDQCNNQRKTIMIRFELLSNGNGLRSCKSKEFSTI